MRGLFEINDLLGELQVKLKQANFVQQDVVEDFFEKWNPFENEEHRYFVAYEFERYIALSQIVQHNLFEINNIAAEMKKLVAEVREQEELQNV